MRCKICSMWKLKDPPDSLSTEDRLKVIDQLVEFRRPVHVVLTGGEPFMKLSEVLELTERAASHGNSVGVVTSGFLLNSNVIDKVCESGLSSLAISLDFPSKAQHDSQRGVIGTFDRIVEALARLKELRDSGVRTPSVGINAVLMAQNLNYIEDLLVLLSNYTIDEVLFQPVQPDFGIDDSVSFVPFRNFLPLNPARVDQALERIRSFKGNVRVPQSNEEFELIRRYFRDPLHLPPGSCQSARRNLMIDVSGNVTHCFGQARTGLPPMGRVPMQNIIELWHSEVAKNGRDKLAICTLGCGALLCHSRSSLPSKPILNS